jgi:hypothetical protein
MRTLVGIVVLAVVVGLGTVVVLVATVAALVALPIGLVLMPVVMPIAWILMRRRKTAALGSPVERRRHELMGTGRRDLTSVH